MGIFMPPDISKRISMFIAGKLDFPFVQANELMAAFYLYGKERGVPASEVSDVEDMAKKSVEQVARDVRLYMSTPKKMDPEFTRENYTKRSLQIAIDGARAEETAARVAGDPAILLDCFAQHIAYHRHGHYFELFKPFRASELPGPLLQRLEGRMVVLGFSAKDRASLPYKTALYPFFEWMLRQGAAKNSTYGR